MKNQSRILAFTFICFFIKILEQPAFSQTWANNPQFKKGYADAAAVWKNDPEFRQSQYRNMELACNHARNRKKRGERGLDNPAELSNEMTAVLVSQGKWYGVGARMFAAQKLREMCPDAI